MPNTGVIVIVQSVPTASVGSTTVVDDNTLQDLIRYYALRHAPWKIEYVPAANNRVHSYQVEQAAAQARTIYDALHAAGQPVVHGHAQLLHKRNKDNGGWKQYWNAVVSNMSARNHMIVALMEDATRHVDVLGSMLCNDPKYSSSFLPSAIHDGRAVIFAPFTVEKFLQRKKNEPYDIATLLKG